MKKFVFIALFLFLAITFLTGTVSAYLIKGVYKDIEAKDVKINGRNYLLLIDVCEANGINWQWDSIAGNITLSKNGCEVTLLVGSKYYHTGTKIGNLSAPVKMKNGAIYIPLKFTKYSIRRLFNLDKEKPAYKETATRSRISKSKKSREKKFRIKKIVIDPGHGGKDPGAIGKTGLYEKHVVLDVSRRIKKELEKNGIDVIMTRDFDKFISLGGRTRIANKNEADFFISIHANANRKHWIRGFEIYYLSEATDDNARALAASENSVLKYEEESFSHHTKVLDAIVWDLGFTENRIESIHLAEFICREVSGKLKMKRNEVRSARFYVLKGAEMPAILVELSYLSNKWDEKNLRKSSYKQKLAEGITAGIMAYKYEYEKTNGFTQ